MTTPTLFLIDTYSLLFQVFHAIPTMTSPKGLPTNAVFGFTRDLLTILKQHQPTHWLCAMDSPGEGTRHALYADYKANRTEMPDDLRPQVPMVQQIMAGFGVPTVQVAGWEADDIIATLSRLAAENGWDVCIVTNDKDARQLLGPRVKLFNVRKNTWFTEAELLADWGVRPEQVIDFQSLVGDSVDNVPGVPLIGPKKATGLLQQFGSLDAVLANADQVAGDKLKANLKQHADLARVSRELVTLNQHLPLEPDWESMRVRHIDPIRLTALFQEFGFRRFIDEVKSLPEDWKLADPTAQATSESTSPMSASPTPSWELIDTDSRRAEFANRWREQKEFCLHLAGSTHHAMRAELLGYAVCWNPGHSFFVPIHGSPASTASQPSEAAVGKLKQQSLFDADTVNETTTSATAGASTTPAISGSDAWAQQSPACTLLREIVMSPGVRIVNHDVKFDVVLLRRLGVPAHELGVDPMVASYLLEAGARSHDLAALVEKHFQRPLTAQPAPDAPLADVAMWACERANFAWQLSLRLADDLRREGLWELYWNLERPLIAVLAEMEATGIRVDVVELQRQSAEVSTRLQSLMSEIHQLAGHEFNIDSPKQLAKVLFDELSLPVLKKLKTGPSTDQDVLEKLALVHPLPAKIMEHRQLSKLKGTYLNALPQDVNPRTGKIHAAFHQTVAATGRLSSADPNLQNIPIRTEGGRQVRRAFVPSEPGWKFLCADYSQIELRMLAHFCGDPVLCEAFANGTDIHTAVASEIFNAAASDVSAEQRRIAKAVNFGVLYGQSPFGLAEALHIDQGEAALFIDQYFAKYAEVDAYITRILAEVAQTGFAKTILGRRRAISGVRPERKRQLNLSERTAINTVIQGSAADLIKQAMIRVHDRLRKDNHPARLLLQIHDELVLEAPAAEVASLARLVRDEMQNAISLRVPLVVDVSTGDNWLDLTDVS